ncbi:ORF7a [Betacoronavirus sp. RsYN04]|nr:ORF7a [Betacoronavirus sp. RmYN05]QWN56247.1 ORF7a [Betacoronavirus sp. RsYN04]
MFLCLLVLITAAYASEYHYQDCVRGTTVLLKEPCPGVTYEGNTPYHPLPDNRLALSCVSTLFTFTCASGERHEFRIRARTFTPRLLSQSADIVQQDLHTPIFLIVVVLVFIIFCFSLKVKSE